MATYTQILYHIVFSTKNRRLTLDEPGREKLFRYIWGILKNHKCHLYRINGMADHIHILTSLHPATSLSDLVREVKVSSSVWCKEQRLFPSFEGWQDGYGAFTVSWAERHGVIEYIKTQAEHHENLSFREEFRQLLNQGGVQYEEKYLE